MQIKNNIKIEWEMRNNKGFTVDKGVGVFNGDMGIITEINDYTEKITVLFDEREKSSIRIASLDELELAYAVTIHKSQGSEYPAVVMPIFKRTKSIIPQKPSVYRSHKSKKLFNDRRRQKYVIFHDPECQ